MKFLKLFLFFLFLLLILIWILNAYVKVRAQSSIYFNIQDIPSVNLIVVPGASVYRSGKLSPILNSRVEASLEYFFSRDSTPLLFSGHSTSQGYNEALAMAQFAKKHHVPDSQTNQDSQGSSTYQTLLNTRLNYNPKTILIVSQAYHLPRALYISQSLGMKAYGLAAERKQEALYKKTPLREILSRVKDFIWVNVLKLFRSEKL